MVNKKKRVEKILQEVPSLTEGQTYWLDRVIEIFKAPSQFELYDSDLFDKATLENFGDALRIHHSFSTEAFSKDKFEYVLERILNMGGHVAELASKGNPGHDITVNKERISLKTQADKDIKHDFIWISKFMELGKGKWADDPDDLIGLRNAFFSHLQKYDRIFTLRTLAKAPEWHYELVEIPKELLLKASGGRLEMRMGSKQNPKPGYCYVTDDKGKLLYQLYFDGGGERKLQVKRLNKALCTLHGVWRFSIPAT